MFVRNSFFSKYNFLFIHKTNEQISINIQTSKPTHKSIHNLTKAPEWGPVKIDSNQCKVSLLKMSG